MELKIWDEKIQHRLLEKKLLIPTQLESTFDQQNHFETTTAKLLAAQLINKTDLRTTLEELTGLRCIDPELLNIYPDFLDKIQSLLPLRLLQKSLCFPFKLDIHHLHVTLVNPFDQALLEELEAGTGLKVKPYICHENGIRGALQKYFTNPLLADGEIPLEQLLIECDRLVNQQLKLLKNPEDFYSVILTAPAILKTTRQLLLQAIENRASDLHFEHEEHLVKIRIRRDGILVPLVSLHKMTGQAISSRLRSMAGLNLQASLLPEDGSINRTLIPGRQIEIRLSSCPTLHGEKIVLRIADKNLKQIGIEELGLAPFQKSCLEKNLNRQNGLILVTGPTGSGKTSTLYAILSALNNGKRNIMTAEDPVERNLPGINQVVCQNEGGLSFAKALKSFLRQDPDVLMVGEIRDEETAGIALKGSLTGHLVLSTLHTNDAPSTLHRLVNMNLDLFTLATAVRLIIAQRLVRKLCADCKIPLTPSEHEKLVQRFPRLKNHLLYAPKGCPNCQHSGYYGRLALFEFLEITPDLEPLILEKAPAHRFRESMQKRNFATLEESAWSALEKGNTSLEEVLSFSLD